jgi:GH24 family phage-related lysozyme (muramidase)
MTDLFDVDPTLISDVAVDEGLSLTAYPDPYSPLGRWLRAGHLRSLMSPDRPRGLSGAPWTIGYGHTGPEVHEGLVWTAGQARAQLAADLRLHNALLARVLPWTWQLDPVRRRVLENMIFNMGWDNPKTPAREGLSGFVHFLAAVQAGAWQKAADCGLDSAWARQVGGRAKRLMGQLVSG